VQTTITFKGHTLAGVALAMIILQFVAPARAWNIILVALGLTLGTAYFWVKTLQTSIQLTRERRYTWAQVGDRLEERFALHNTGHVPVLWVEIIDQSTLPGYTASRVIGIGINTFTRWHSDVICMQRGVFQLGPITLNTGDPFGLFELRQYYPNTIDFTIIPPILPLPTLTVASRGETGEKVTRPYSLSRTQASAGVRLYQSGDSLSKIHWPTTARRNEFYIRKFETASTGDWWLVPDLDAQAHYGSGTSSTLEKAILITSSLADKGLRHHRAVGLLAHGDRALWLPPVASPIQRTQILKALAQIEAGNIPLKDVLDRSRLSLTRNTSLIVITAESNLEWLDPLLFLQRRGIVPTVILIFNSQTSLQAQAAHHWLTGADITVHLIDETSVIPPTPKDAAGKWAWHITGTGKAVPVQRPQGNWRQL